MLPSTLSNYKMLRPIGGGTFARVKLAIHLPTSRQVAIKILNKSEITSKKISQKIRQEIEILKSFHHPNIVRLYDLIESPSNIFLVMEYLPGGELYNLIEKYRITEDQARHYFIQILQGLDYIHNNGFAHRDLKPENLLIDGFGNIKIGDFGLSNKLKPGEFMKTQCGSPNYASPEVISGEKYCGSQADVWSLGVVLYAMVARELPFDNESIPALFLLIKSGRFKVASFFSEDLKDLVSRMLIVDPVTRITVEQIKKHPWLMNGFQGFKTNIDARAKEKAVRQCLEVERWAGIGFEQGIKIVEEGKNCEFLAGFNILIEGENKEIIERCKVNPVRALDKKSLNKSSKTTSASSLLSDYYEKLTPNNWVYGFRLNIDINNLLGSIFIYFKSAGFHWKKVGNYFTIKKQAKFILKLYKYEETLVIDFTLKQGNNLVFLDCISTIYSHIYALTLSFS